MLDSFSESFNFSSFTSEVGTCSSPCIPVPQCPIQETVSSTAAPHTGDSAFNRHHIALDPVAEPNQHTQQARCVSAAKHSTNVFSSLQKQCDLSVRTDQTTTSVISRCILMCWHDTTSANYKASIKSTNTTHTQNKAKNSTYNSDNNFCLRLVSRCKLIKPICRFACTHIFAVKKPGKLLPTRTHKVHPVVSVFHIVAQQMSP